MNINTLEIIDYNDSLKSYIKTLNYEWLEAYFRLEQSDITSLSDPKGEILDKGGFIYFARLNTNIIGTVSLLKKTNTIYEIGKMAVSKHAQGLGIGTLLLEHCLQVAQEKNILKLVLYSNTKLKSALHLYTKYGFIETELETGLYDRADIKMEKTIG